MTTHEIEKNLTRYERKKQIRKQMETKAIRFDIAYEDGGEVKIVTDYQLIYKPMGKGRYRLEIYKSGKGLGSTEIFSYGLSQKKAKDDLIEYVILAA